MADGFWNMQPPLHPSAPMVKRPRPEYDLASSGLASGHEFHNYLQHANGPGGPQGTNDSQTIGSAYDHYLQSMQPPVNSGEANNFGPGRAAGVGTGGFTGMPMTDPPCYGVGARPDIVPNGRGMGYDSQFPVDRFAMSARDVTPLPPDASNTLYVEGLPPNTTKREVAHIFRPFVGYRDVRLVTKESKHRGGDPLILCFVDFLNPACAATALNALQGYNMDEGDPDSAYLRLQFSRYPGPRAAMSTHRMNR